MKKNLISGVLLMLLFSLLFFSCTKESEDLWAPPIKGLEWGMSFDEVDSVLEIKNAYETYPEMDTLQAVLVHGNYTSIYGVELNDLTLTFMDQSEYIEGYGGLIRVSAKCKTSDIDTLKNNLNDKLAAYRKTDNFSNNTRWEAGIVNELPDVEQLQNSYSSAIGNIPNYDDDIKGYNLGEITLEETGESAGTIVISGRTQVLINALRKQKE